MLRFLDWMAFIVTWLMIAFLLIIGVLMFVSCVSGDGLSRAEEPDATIACYTPDAADCPQVDAMTCPALYCPSCPTPEDAGYEPPPAMGAQLVAMVYGASGNTKCWFDLSWPVLAIDALCEDCLETNGYCRLFGLDQTIPYGVLPCPKDDTWCDSR